MVNRDAPYELTEDWVDKLVREYKIDYIVHGDDACFTADGRDAYAYAKKLGIFKTIKRTHGVSTTDIVGRMLLCSREHHMREEGGATPSSIRDRAGSAVRN